MAWQFLLANWAWDSLHCFLAWVIGRMMVIIYWGEEQILGKNQLRVALLCNVEKSVYDMWNCNKMICLCLKLKTVLRSEERILDIININSILLLNPWEWMWFSMRHVIELGPPLSESKGASFYGIHLWYVSPFQKFSLKISIYGEFFYSPGPSKTLLWTKAEWCSLGDDISLYSAH